jgi:hypothetical protein
MAHSVGPSPRGNLVLLCLFCFCVVVFLLNSATENILEIIVSVICGTVCFLRYRKAARL